MSTVHQRLQAYLAANGVAYRTIPHRPDTTGRETVADAHTPDKEFAKTVIIWVDGVFAMVVIPAHHKINWKRLGEQFGIGTVKSVQGNEISRLFPDSEPDAILPFGNLHGLPVMVSSALSTNDHISFNAGKHVGMIRMSYKDFDRLAQTTAMECSEPIDELTQRTIRASADR